MNPGCSFVAVVMGSMTRLDGPADDPSVALEFSEFYRQELTKQVRRAALILGSDEAANDVVHDSFAKVFARWGEIEEPGGYLQRTVLNGCRDGQRRAKRLRKLLPRLVGDPVIPEEETLWDVVSHLPFNQRAAVVLRFYERMTEAEIAQTMNCPTGSVGPWISAALTTMRKELQ